MKNSGSPGRGELLTGGRTRKNCTRFLTGGRRGTQGTNFIGKMKQWDNKEPLPAVLTTWAFITELPQKRKNQTHTEAAEMKRYLDWLETSQGFFTVSTRSTTDWQRESKTTPSQGAQQTPNPWHALGQGGADVVKWPQRVKLHWGGYRTSSSWQHHGTTGGTHMEITSSRAKTPNNLTQLNCWARPGGRNKISELELIWIRDSWAAIEYKLS